MDEIGMTGNGNARRALSLVMSILAFVSSGTFAYAAKSCETELQQVREQVAELKISQGQALAEREDARTQLAAAQEEVADLKADRDQLIAERDGQGAACRRSAGGSGANKEARRS